MSEHTPSTPESDRELRPAKGGGVSTGVFQNTVGTFAKFAEEANENQKESSSQTIRILGGIIVVQALIIAMIVAGLVGVGITGTVPGVGDISISKDKGGP